MSVQLSFSFSHQHQSSSPFPSPTPPLIFFFLHFFHYLAMTLSFPFIHSHCTSHSLSPFFFPLYPIKSGLRRRPCGVRMDSPATASTALHLHLHPRHKEKIVVIMGPTGCGKTRLSIDLASRFQSEIVNSDKIQVYKGLDITTNKIPIQDRLGIPHHLLGVFYPEDGELTPSEFRFRAGLAISDIVSRQKLPLVVGGSNSFIHALVVDRFNPEMDVFDTPSNLISTELRYNCCFLWVDISFPLLCDYLCKRVDEMLGSGMFEELSKYYGSDESGSQLGLRKAIGVPEFDRYFKKYPPGTGGRGGWDEVRRGAYEEAVREIKENTCELAKRQIGKILRLENAGWDLQRVDATEAFREMMKVSTADNGKNNKKKKRRKKRKKKKRWMEIWEREVTEPSMKIVSRFLEE